MSPSLQQLLSELDPQLNEYTDFVTKFEEWFVARQQQRGLATLQLHPLERAILISFLVYLREQHKT